MKLPTELLQKMQGDYVSYKYRDGIFTFPTIDDATLSIFIKSFVDWVYTNKYVDEDDKLDMSEIKNW